MQVRYEARAITAFEPMNINPQNGIDASITWEKEDLPRYDFKQKLKDITLVGEDFNKFYAIEKSDNRCDRFLFKVILECTGASDHIIFDGYFSMSKGKWDLDECKVVFNINWNDPYECIDKNDEEYNMFDRGLNRPDVNLGVSFRIGHYACWSDNFGGVPCDAFELGLLQWTLIEYVQATPELVHYRFFRNELFCDCDFDPGDDWVEVFPCTDGVKVYAKPFDIDNNSGTVDAFLSSIGTVDAPPFLQEVSVIDNGMSFFDLLQNLLFEICPGTVIVSDFFQYNPENPSQINYVNNQENLLTNIFIFQKSDVKRHYASNNASKGLVKFKKKLEQICQMTNCGYKFIDGKLRIEHVSWFQTDLGLNLLSFDNALIQGTKKYEYDLSKVSDKEAFEFMESGNEDFIGHPITYDNGCFDGNNKADNDIKIEDITTDLLYCLENPASSNSNVSDDGFVLLACDNNNNVITSIGILSGQNVMNYPLTWSYLHENFFRHGRFELEGTLNDQPTTFESKLPQIKQEKFSAVLPCKYIKWFDPLDKIRGQLGYGYVSNAELVLSQCVLNLELLLDSIDDSDYEGTFGDFDTNFSEDFD